MFPVTITIHNATDLHKVMVALDATKIVVEESTKPPAEAPGKPSSASKAASAPSPRTAAPTTPSAPTSAAPAPTPPSTATPAAASSASAAGEVSYADVQKAVAKLYAKDQALCSAIPAEFGLATYKDLNLPEHVGKRQAVLERVNAALGV